MLSSIKHLANRRAVVASSTQQLQATSHICRRFYTNDPSEGTTSKYGPAATNTNDSPSNSKSTTGRPATNPGESSLGSQEEPDHIKRQHVEAEGEKPLDPADDGFGIVGKDPSK